MQATMSVHVKNNLKNLCQCSVNLSRNYAKKHLGNITCKIEAEQSFSAIRFAFVFTYNRGH